MTRVHKFAAIVTVGALALAACGSDDDEPTTTEATEATEATTPPEGTEPMPDDTTAATEPETDETTAATDGEAEGEAFAVDVEACEEPEAATAEIDALKIGTSIPLSGGPAVLFAPFGDGMQAYVDYYNAEFGGINDQPIELVIKDDQYTAGLTVQAVDELVFDDQVDILAGVIGSPNNLAIQEDMNALCIPQLWAATGAPNWGAVDEYPWTTGLLVPYDIESRVWADYVLETYGEGATVAVFHVNNEFGQAYVDAFTEYAEANGLEIVATETIEAADSGAPTAQMTNLVNANPDAILAIPLGAQCIAFMTELGNAKAANADFAPDVYQTATCANPIFFGAVANGGNDGVYTSANLIDVNSPDNADNEAVVQYKDAFASTGSTADPGGIAVAGWLAAEMAVHVAQQAADAGQLTREGIINAARNVDYQASLLREGLNFRMNAADGFIAEGTQLQQWDAANAVFVDAGDLVDYEGELGVYTP
jgi:branched-chain amino acid transport system substrate-binding protein